jgi:homoserine O-acetyltransferase
VYGYRDMVDLQHRLITEKLEIEHLYAILEMSMRNESMAVGEAYPDATDGVMPLVSMPFPVSGRNMIWRRIISDAIRSDPKWNGGQLYLTR